MTNLRTLSSLDFTSLQAEAIINQYLRLLPFTGLLSLFLVSSVVICLIFHSKQVQTEASRAMYKVLLSEKALVVHLLSQYIYLQGA